MALSTAEKNLIANRARAMARGLWRASSVICSRCVHFNRKNVLLRRCAAFDNIPEEIFSGENDHTQPYPGDNGIRFKPDRTKLVMT